MSTNQTIIEQVTPLVQGLLADKPAYFLVLVKVKPTHNIKVYIDGDSGVPIGDLARMNRQLYAAIEETGMFPEGEFSLELSSPGIDEPLQLHRQYVKNIGRSVTVTLLDETELTGVLTAVADDQFTVQIEKGKGKKKEIISTDITFATVKTTTVNVVF